jgi:hypothetical protein
MIIYVCSYDCIGAPMEIQKDISKAWTLSDKGTTVQEKEVNDRLQAMTDPFYLYNLLYKK